MTQGLHAVASPPLVKSSLIISRLLFCALQAGDKVVCVEDGLPTWVCELMVVKPTVEEAIAFVKQIEAELDIPIDPASPTMK